MSESNAEEGGAVELPFDDEDERRALEARFIERVEKRVAAEKAESVGDIAAVIASAAARATGLPVEEIKAQAQNVNFDSWGYPKREPREIARGHMFDAGVPERHIRNIADREPDDCLALREVKAFMADPDAWCLVLSGGVGTRKTGSACWAFTKHRGPAYFIAADDLTGMAIRDEKQFERIKRACLLVIDELGSERRDEKGYFVGIFTSLMNHRYANCAKTIVTSNIAAKDLAKPVEQGGLGERIVDRLREHGRVVQIAEPSVRRERGTR